MKATRTFNFSATLLESRIGRSSEQQYDHLIKTP
jgi:hypothetical protein